VDTHNPSETRKEYPYLAPHNRRWWALSLRHCPLKVPVAGTCRQYDLLLKCNDLGPVDATRHRGATGSRSPTGRSRYGGKKPL